MNFHCPAEIHLCNRNGQVVVSKGVSFFRNLTQLVHNPSADGSIVVVLFNLEQLSYLIQGGATVDGIAAVLVFLNLLGDFVMLVPNLTDQFFQNILQRYNNSSTTTAMCDL